MNLRGAILATEASSWTSTASGLSPTRATKLASHTRLVSTASAPSSGTAGSTGLSGCPMGQR